MVEHINEIDDLGASWSSTEGSRVDVEILVPFMSTYLQGIESNHKYIL
jgi:hypothetical protein